MKKKGRLVDMKKLIVILFIIFGAFLTFSLYRTFAYDTSVVEEVPSTTDLEYTFKIGNSSIKQITVDSGETRYYDIVLGNPNNAKISYSVYYEMVSPSTKHDDYKIEYTSKSTGNSTGIVNNNGNITLNIVVTNTSSNAVTVKVGTVAGYVKGGELTLGSVQVVIPKKVTASEYIMNLDDGTTGDSGSGVYKIHHDAILADSSATGNEIKQTTDYRYYGPSSNNYICLDMEGGSTCPDRGLFRIIGSIYEENAGKNLLKVIKATPLTDGTTSTFSWDYKVTNGSGSYNNVWSSATSGTSSGATLMQLLNGIYLTRGSGSYYNESTTATTVNFGSTGLTDVAQALMNTGNNNNNLSRYYLGGYSDTSLKTDTIYLAERGKTTSSGNALYWDGMVGLMYPSDFGYAAGNDCVINTAPYDYAGDCHNKNWLYRDDVERTMTSNASDANNVWYVYYGNAGDGTPTYPVSSRPVFYLDKDVVITSGTGTSSDPYIISK